MAREPDGTLTISVEFILDGIRFVEQRKLSREDYREGKVYLRSAVYSDMLAAVDRTIEAAEYRRGKLYAIYPGEVRSQTDEQIHSITSEMLAALYQVRLEDCIIVTENDLHSPTNRVKCEAAAALKGLYPRYDGDYTLK